LAVADKAEGKAMKSGDWLRPIFALLAAVIVGILVAPYLPFSWRVLVPLAFLTAGGAAVIYRRSERIAFTLFVLTFAILGAGRAREESLPAPSDISHRNGGPSIWVRGIVASHVEIRSRGTASFVLNALTVHDYERSVSVTGRVRVSVLTPAYDGDTTKLPDPGDEVWLRGRLTVPQEATNPGGFDYRAYLARRGIFTILIARRPNDLRSNGVSHSSWVGKAAFAVRTMIQNATTASLSTHDAALMNGLLLSVQHRIPVRTRTAFMRTGTVHILSVSGMHITVLSVFLVAVLLLVRAPHPAACAASVVLIWLFTLAAGASEPAVRSAIIATLFYMASFVGRTGEPFHALAAAAFGILLWTPGALYDAPFQLSFTMTLFLFWMGAPLKELLWARERRMNRTVLLVRRYLFLPLLAGIIAQAACAPLVAYHFNLFSTVAPIANIPVALLSEILLLLGLAASALTALVGPLTVPLWGLIALLLRVLETVTFAFDRLPFSAVSVVSPPLAGILVYYLLLGGIAAYVRQNVLHKRLFAPTPPDTAAIFSSAESRLSVPVA
jgi:competence protein ComEC